MHNAISALPMLAAWFVVFGTFLISQSGPKFTPLDGAADSDEGWD